MKIAFCGTQSVGKSTLVKDLLKLSQFKDYKVFTERSAYLSKLGISLNEDSTYKGQLIFTAERASELMNLNFLSDRSAIDVVAFAYSSKEMSDEEKQLISLINEPLIYEYDYVFYIPPEIPLKDNGIRNTDEEYRIEINNIIKSLLIKLGIHYFEIDGTQEERINKILEILK